MWHRCFGHINYERLKLLHDKGIIIDGINFTKKEFDEAIKQKCEICIKSKMSTLPYNKTINTRSVHPLQLIHTDICGPITPYSRENKRYFVTFIGDFIAFKIVYPMKEICDMFQFFKKYEALVTAHFNSRISTVRCDRGANVHLKILYPFVVKKGLDYNILDQVHHS